MGQTIKSLFAASAVIFAASAALAGEPVAIVERTQAVSADIWSDPLGVVQFY